jgi:hypothetical protein
MGDFEEPWASGAILWPEGLPLGIPSLNCLFNNITNIIGHDTMFHCKETAVDIGYMDQYCINSFYNACFCLWDMEQPQKVWGKTLTKRQSALHHMMTLTFIMMNDIMITCGSNLMLAEWPRVHLYTLASFFSLQVWNCKPPTFNTNWPRSPGRDLQYRLVRSDTLDGSKQPISFKQRYTLGRWKIFILKTTNHKIWFKPKMIHAAYRISRILVLPKPPLYMYRLDGLLTFYRYCPALKDSENPTNHHKLNHHEFQWLRKV